MWYYWVFEPRSRKRFHTDTLFACSVLLTSPVLEHVALSVKPFNLLFASRSVVWWRPRRFPFLLGFRSNRVLALTYTARLHIVVSTRKTTQYSYRFRSKRGDVCYIYTDSTYKIIVTSLRHTRIVYTRTLCNIILSHARLYSHRAIFIIRAVPKHVVAAKIFVPLSSPLRLITTMLYHRLEWLSKKTRVSGYST